MIGMMAGKVSHWSELGVVGIIYWLSLLAVGVLHWLGSGVFLINKDGSCRSYVEARVWKLMKLFIRYGLELSELFIVDSISCRDLKNG